MIYSGGPAAPAFQSCTIRHNEIPKYCSTEMNSHSSTATQSCPCHSQVQGVRRFSEPRGIQKCLFSGRAERRNISKTTPLLPALTEISADQYRHNAFLNHRAAHLGMEGKAVFTYTYMNLNFLENFQNRNENGISKLLPGRDQVASTIDFL